METNAFLKIPEGLMKKIERNPYPMHRLKRLDRPTTSIGPNIKRMDEREQGFSRALRGDFGLKLQQARLQSAKKHPLSGALMQMAHHLVPVVDGPVAPEKAPLPDDPALIARHIKELAYFLRADLVGICELPPYAVYSHSMADGQPVELTHKYAVAILIDQDWETANAFTGNDWISNSMSWMSYSASGFIACIMADYIRRLGYPARAHHARNYQVVVPPILLWAGLGEMCRIGDIVLNLFFGPRFKAAVVTTDLPLAVDRPIDVGVQDFCSKCKKCARECPSGAISSGEKIIYNDYERWPTDVEKCTGMRVGNTKGAGCGKCVKVCPWNKPYTSFHRAVGWAVQHSSLVRRFAILGDDLLGYGKPKPENKWWFDLTDVNGRLQIPTTIGCRNTPNGKG